MSKTPYEIRLELLKLAAEILTTPVFQKRDQLRDQYHVSLELDKENPPDYPELPEFPTTEAIIAEADKFNKFISNG